MAIWFVATMRPRISGGDFRDIHRRGNGGDADGEPAEEAEQDEGVMSVGIEVPMAETKNMIAARNMANLRPKRSDIGPTNSTPAAQPRMTQADAQPFMNGQMANLAFSGSMAPEITPVS